MKALLGPSGIVSIGPRQRPGDDQAWDGLPAGAAALRVEGGLRSHAPVSV
jgi:hypothetical protein